MVLRRVSLIAQSLTMSAHCRQSKRQNIIDRTHTWQQCSVTLSGDILTTKYGFNLRKISPLSIHNELDNNTGWRLACRACANRSAQSPSWHTFEATHPTLSGIKSKGSGETVETLWVPTSPQGEHSLAEPRHRPLMTFAWCLHALKIVLGFPIHVAN